MAIQRFLDRINFCFMVKWLIIGLTALFAIPGLLLLWLILAQGGSGGLYYIFSAPYVVRSPGYYNVMADLWVNGTAIVVEASNVVINGWGHKIRGTGYGIYIAPGVSNVTVADLALEGFRYGVRGEGVNYVALYRVNASGGGVGISLSGNYISLVSVSADHNSGDGIDCAGNYIYVASSNADYNGGYGAFISGNYIVVKRFNATGDLRQGLRIEGSHVVVQGINGSALSIGW
ncbi:Predicted surface protein [Thermoproteus tenax Kra 1]|uniref:Predicted surface protein n=2 Tax=Thermoproteus tenax TaxID=2271 RepID=G4RK12_THETK|nr:Predicted surface protein [Thermoproteus tenax Kra 1]